MILNDFLEIERKPILLINWSQLNRLNISVPYPRMKEIKREKNSTITNDMCFSSLPVLTNCYDSPTYSLNIVIHKLSVPTIPSTIIVLYRSIPFCFPSLFLLFLTCTATYISSNPHLYFFLFLILVSFSIPFKFLFFCVV